MCCSVVIVFVSVLMLWNRLWFSILLGILMLNCFLIVSISWIVLSEERFVL